MRITIAIISVYALAGYSFAAPISGGAGSTSYTCNSQTESCTCTSYDDCKRLEGSGQCRGEGIDSCVTAKSGNKCFCKFDTGAQASAAGAPSGAGASYTCQNEPGTNACLCTDYFDCRDMEAHACKAGTLTCIPGTFNCSCEWKSAQKYGEEQKPKEGRTSTAPAKASAGSSGECDPATEPELPKEGPPPSKVRPGYEWKHGYNRCVDGEWQYVKPAWERTRSR